jgi:hypothetical protein
MADLSAMTDADNSGGSRDTVPGLRFVCKLQYTNRPTPNGSPSFSSSLFFAKRFPISASFI